MGTPRVEVDQEMCIGSGNCVEVAKGVFQLNDEDKAEVVDPTAQDIETLRKARPGLGRYHDGSYLAGDPARTRTPRGVPSSHLFRGGPVADRHLLAIAELLRRPSSRRSGAVPKTFLSGTRKIRDSPNGVLGVRAACSALALRCRRLPSQPAGSADLRGSLRGGAPEAKPSRTRRGGATRSPSHLPRSAPLASGRVGRSKPLRARARGRSSRRFGRRRRPT
jgi:ferredoxin